MNTDFHDMNAGGLPPPFGYDGGVTDGPGAEIVDGTVVTTPPTPDGDTIKEDTLTTYIVGDQSARIYGNGIGNPDIPPPGNQDNGGGSVTASNPFFLPSFAAVFGYFMNDIIDLNRDSRYLTAQTEIQSRQRLIEMAKTTAELTKQVYDLQAQEKMMEAVSSFVSAAVGFISAAVTIRMHVKTAKVEGEKRYQQAVNDQEQAVTDINNRIKVLEDKQKAAAAVASKPGDTQQPPPKLTTAEENKLASLRLQKPEAEKKLADLKANEQFYKDQYTDQYRNFVSPQINSFTQALQSVAKGTVDAMIATIKTEQGAVSAIKDALEGYVRAETTFLDNTKSSKDQFYSNLNKLFETLEQIMRSNSQAHSMNPH